MTKETLGSSTDSRAEQVVLAMVQEYSPASDNSASEISSSCFFVRGYMKPNSGLIAQRLTPVLISWLPW